MMMNVSDGGCRRGEKMKSLQQEDERSPREYGVTVFMLRTCAAVGEPTFCAVHPILPAQPHAGRVTTMK